MLSGLSTVHVENQEKPSREMCPEIKGQTALGADNGTIPNPISPVHHIPVYLS